MLTLHRATALLISATASSADLEPVAVEPVAASSAAVELADGAVLVRGELVAGIGPYAELAAAHPDARVREWPGRLTAGLAQPHGRLLLEHRYHPDPREELGEDPLPPPPGLDEAGWGGSARRGLQRMLAHGTTALAGPFERPAVRTAVRRSGLLVLPPFKVATSEVATSEAATSDPDLTGVAYRTLAVGERADFAIFGLPDGDCLGTVLAGRLLHRRR